MINFIKKLLERKKIRELKMNLEKLKNTVQ